MLTCVCEAADVAQAHLKTIHILDNSMPPDRGIQGSTGQYWQDCKLYCRSQVRANERTLAPATSWKYIPPELGVALIVQQVEGLTNL